MKKYWILLAMLLIPIIDYGQFYSNWNKGNLEIVPYKSGKFWGIKNTQSGEIVLIPTYKKIVRSYLDSVFIVRDVNMDYSAVDRNGKIIVKAQSDWIFFNEVDTANRYGELMTVPSKINEKLNWREYFINKDRECIQTRYFLCPYGVSIDKNVPLDKYQELQSAENNLFYHNVDGAIKIYKAAIERYPDDPFVYYWISKSLLFNRQYDLNYETESVKNNKDFIRSCLFKALELEKDIHYRIRNYKLLSLYYQEIEVDPLNVAKYDQEMELLKNIIKHEYRASYWWTNY